MTNIALHDMTIANRRPGSGLGAFPSPLAVDRFSREPFHRQIYAWYQAAISDGRLRPGQTLPSTRALAAELKVSRAPVLAAFEQLTAEGYLEAVVGSGTRVCATMTSAGRPRSQGEVARARLARGDRRISRRASALVLPEQPWLAHPGAFRASLPALDKFPSQTWATLMARHSRGRSPATMGYGDPMGHLPLREAVARYLGAARGVRCTASQVMIVSGSQQGLHVAARALLDAGDRILVEEPGYPGAHAAFASAQLAMVPVRVDPEGLVVAEGTLAAPDARAAYVTPSHQYPLGAGMSAPRRLQLLGWARERSAWIIEDDYDSEFRYGARPMPALQGLDAACRTIYVGTFSKVMFPALRVGYLVVPEDLVPAFRAIRESNDIFASTPTQAALADFLSEGHFARHLRRMRLVYEKRRAWLRSALESRLERRLSVSGIEAGMHLTGLLGDGADDVALCSRLSALGVSSIPLSTCFLAAPASPGLILGYGNADEAELARGVAALEAVLPPG